MQEEDSLRGMTVEGVLANTIQPLKGLDKRTCWISQESVMYGNIVPERRAQLLAITGACSGDDVLTKIYTVNVLIEYWDGNGKYVSAWHHIVSPPFSGTKAGGNGQPRLHFLRGPGHALPDREVHQVPAGRHVAADETRV